MNAVPVVTVVEAVAVVVLMFALGATLRLRGILNADVAPLFARVVTDLLLPALIFHSLVSAQYRFQDLEPALVLAVAEVIVLTFALIGARAIGLPRAGQGAVMLCAAFGSSALLGYAFVAEMFHAQATAIMNAVLISEIGVGFPMFTLGVAVAIVFGERQATGRAAFFGAVFGYLKSPIFLATAAGLAWSAAGLPASGPVLDIVLRAFGELGAAMPAFVAVIVGMMLRPVPMRTILLSVALAGVLKLLAEPLLSAGGAMVLGFDASVTEVLILMAAMPSATLAAVFAARYGCDGGLATGIVVATTGFSILTVPLCIAVLV